jgi:hypothetical protein
MTDTRPTPDVERALTAAAPVDCRVCGHSCDAGAAPVAPEPPTAEAPITDASPCPTCGKRYDAHDPDGGHGMLGCPDPIDHTANGFPAPVAAEEAATPAPDLGPFPACPGAVPRPLLPNTVSAGEAAQLNADRRVQP